MRLTQIQSVDGGMGMQYGVVYLGNFSQVAVVASDDTTSSVHEEGGHM